MMFCSSRIKKLGITTAIIIIVIALIKVCYVCEEGFVSNQEEKDLVKQYAMRARKLPAKFVNGMPTESSNQKQKEMYTDILDNSTSVEDAKQKYEKYAKLYPPLDFIDEEPHNKVKDDNFECSRKKCDTGYNYRGAKDSTVRTSKGRVILLVEEIKPAIIQTLKHQGIYDDLNIMKEIVHNWMFEIQINGIYTMFSPLMRCNHDYGQDDKGRETIEIKTFPPSEFSDGAVTTQSISWYQCGGPKSPSREKSEARIKAIAEANAEANAKADAYEEAEAKAKADAYEEAEAKAKAKAYAYEEAKAKADAEAAAKIKGNTASEPAGGTFAPHDQVGSILDENNSPFEKIVDNNTVIGPPGILGPSSLIPPDSRPVNIIITSNVGPYGLVTNPRKPQEISYNHELGDKTNTQVNKTMSFMEHVMNTSR